MTDMQQTLIDTIIAGDCLAVLPNLTPQSVKLVFTSPPYPGQKGNGQSVSEWLDWLNQVIAQIRPLLVDNAIVALNIMFKRTEAGWFDTRLFSAVSTVFVSNGLHCLDIPIWHKTNAPQNGPLLYCDAPGYEPVFVFTNATSPMHVAFHPQYRPYAVKSINGDGKARIGYGRVKEPNGNGARQTNVISLPTVASDGTRPRAKGTSFPLALAERMIRTYTRPGDVVLDFCAGVGTTCKKAQELDRRYIGIELDPGEAEKARHWLARPVQLDLLQNISNVCTPTGVAEWAVSTPEMLQ